MVFQSIFSTLFQSIFSTLFHPRPLLWFYSGSTVDSQCVCYAAKRGQKFCDRYRFAARTTGTLDPANSREVVDDLLRSGAYAYIRVLAQYTRETAAGPVTLYAICVLVYAYSI